MTITHPLLKQSKVISCKIFHPFSWPQKSSISAGFKNNIIKVQKADFDAFEALDMDSEAVAKAAAHKRQQNASVTSSSFGQVKLEKVW